jgi:hypothetical protein
MVSLEVESLVFEMGHSKVHSMDSYMVVLMDCLGVGKTVVGLAFVTDLL